jgi:hypothetical protein
MLQADHIIALGMTTLDVLAEAKTVEMSHPMRLRCRSCANSLSRSTLQTEKALDQRLRDELPAAQAAMQEPVDDMREVETMAAIQQAKAKIDTHCPRAYPATGPPLATERPRGSAHRLIFYFLASLLYRFAIANHDVRHRPHHGKPPKSWTTVSLMPVIRFGSGRRKPPTEAFRGRSAAEVSAWRVAAATPSMSRTGT